MSTSALFGRDEETIYCAAKWGARGYTEALRTELKGTKRKYYCSISRRNENRFLEDAGTEP